MATSAVLSYVSNNTYPDSEHVSSSTLSSNDLASLLASLRVEQESTRSEIRSLSRSTAGDIDSWIAHAKTLQADILRSRDTARQIVADAEAGHALTADAEEKERKVGLLEREVEFNETLTGTLEHVRHANGLLERTQDAAVLGDVGRALQRMEDAEASILGLESVTPSAQSSRAVEILNQRKDELKSNLIETSTEFWDDFINVSYDERKVSVKTTGIPAALPGSAGSDFGIEQIVMAAGGLGILATLTQKLAHDIERVILRPRLLIDDEGLVAKIGISFDERLELAAGGKGTDLSISTLFRDLSAVVKFFASSLPESITTLMSKTLVPTLTTLLEEHWLDPAIPVIMSETMPFTTVLGHVEALAEQIDGYRWRGTEGLREWVRNAPKAWLTKRREAVLGDARNLVFSGLDERHRVERVETRVVSQNDPVLKESRDNTNDDAWDEDWGEAEEKASVPNLEGHPESVQDDEDDEETSAWDVDDDDPLSKNESATGQDEDDAWGAWDDDEIQKPPSPAASRKQQPGSQPNGAATTAAAEQEMTLRETFTVTAVPDGIFSILQQLISDAESLAGPDLNSSPLVPASQALYTLPTLALAIYRATAPTAYNKLDVGNMLIYNDSLRLAELLRSWQDSRPRGVGRLRLESDVAALENFAKRAYSSEMESQRTILRDLLDGAQGFGNCTVQPFRSECENAVDGVRSRLRDVHNMWKDILSQGALLQSLGSLLSIVTTKMVTEVEDLGDISEADSHQLNALCQRVMGITSLFTQTSPQGEEQDMTFIYSPTWLKFQYLAEILESSLADINWMWKEGELSLEFDAEEVVELVEALFAESELRRQAVRDIRSGRRY